MSFCTIDRELCDLRSTLETDCELLLHHAMSLPGARRSVFRRGSGRTENSKESRGTNYSTSQRGIWTVMNDGCSATSAGCDLRGREWPAPESCSSTARHKFLLMTHEQAGMRRLYTHSSAIKTRPSESSVAVCPGKLRKNRRISLDV